MMEELEASLRAAQKPAGRVVTSNGEIVRRRINRICEANGLPNVGIHGLRHSFVSLAYHFRRLGKDCHGDRRVGGLSDYAEDIHPYSAVGRGKVCGAVWQLLFQKYGKARVIRVCSTT